MLYVPSQCSFSSHSNAAASRRNANNTFNATEKWVRYIFNGVKTRRVVALGWRHYRCFWLSVGKTPAVTTARKFEPARLLCSTCSSVSRPPSKMSLHEQREFSLNSETQTKRSDKSHSVECDAKPPTYSPLDGVDRGAAAGAGAVVGLQCHFVGRT